MKVSSIILTAKTFIFFTMLDFGGIEITPESKFIDKPLPCEEILIITITEIDYKL